MNRIEIDLTNADEKRIERIRELRTSGQFQPTDQEIIRVALITYWQAAEERNSKKS